MSSRYAVGLAVLGVACASAAYFLWPYGNGRSSLQLSGVVEIQEVRLGSKVGGRVEKVEVQEGDLVAPGDVLVRFETPELQTQREQMQSRLQASEAELEKARNGFRAEEKDAARAAVDAAKAKLDRIKAGWREEEKRQAKSELESAEADLKFARDDFDRVDRLHRQGSTSRSDFDAARAARDRATGRTAAARAHHDMIQAGSRVEDVAEATAEWTKAKANFDLLQAGTRSEDMALAEARVAELRGKLKEIDVSLREAVVHAPEKAVVEVVAVRKGDLVPPNQPVVKVLRADDLWVKVYVPETELGKVRLHQDVEVLIDSYPGRRFPGKVVQIASESEFTPRNVQSLDERRHQVFGVKVHVPDPQGIFKSGMAADVLVPLHD